MFKIPEGYKLRYRFAEGKDGLCDVTVLAILPSTDPQWEVLIVFALKDNPEEPLKTDYLDVEKMNFLLVREGG